MNNQGDLTRYFCQKHKTIYKSKKSYQKMTEQQIIFRTFEQNLLT